MDSRPWIITDPTGEWLLGTFPTENQRDAALLTGKYPDDAEPAYLNPPGVPDCGDPGPDCEEHAGACD